jgi:magnesium transporter
MYEMKEDLTMARHRHRVSQKKGMPPGSLVYVGEKKTTETKLTLFTYNEEGFSESSADNTKDIIRRVEPDHVNWINISGLSRTEIIGEIGEHFHLHPLTLEDILHTGQRPKLEDHGDYLYLVLKILYPAGDSDKIQYDQVSFILGNNYILSFLESDRDVFDPVRERIRKLKGKIRSLKADYLLYSLIDSIVDHYYVVIEMIGDDIESTEEELISEPTANVLQRIHGLRTEMLYLRRSIWPLREVIGSLERSETGLIKEGISIYLRDIYDHTIQAIDTIEMYRDIISGMLDTYLTSLSNRMNEIMKVLTIFSTIFIPLTFLVGVYGMNFKYMPELRWPWGYPLLWTIMIGIGLVMLNYFRKKRWI